MLIWLKTIKSNIKAKRRLARDVAIAKHGIWWNKVLEDHKEKLAELEKVASKYDIDHFIVMDRYEFGSQTLDKTAHLWWAFLQEIKSLRARVDELEKKGK